MHPRDHQDLVERFWWTRFIPASISDPILPRLSGRVGFTVCEKADGYDNLEIYLIAVLLKGHQIVSTSSKELRTVRRRILEVVHFAQHNIKADVIGLGALTASVTNGGQWLVNQDGFFPNITHGDAYATSISVEGIDKVVSLSGLSNPVIAIVGAYGIIGTAVCKILSTKYPLIMMGRNKAKLSRVHESLNGKAMVTTDINKIKEADIVVTATSHPQALMRSEYLKHGAIVYDISQPENVSKALLKERPDVLKIDGSLAKIPGINIKFDMRTGKGATFACLAETILMTLENIKGHFVGEVDLQHMERLKSIGKKYGFSHAEFTQFGDKISREQLSR